MRDLGPLGDAEAPNLLRDGGSSVPIAGHILWAFGDTIFPFLAADGTHLRSNSAALAPPAAPLSLSEPLDPNGAPFQFVPFTPDEAAFNASSSDERIALWPTTMVPWKDGSALVIIDRLKVHPGVLDYEELSTELGVVTGASTTASRLGALFRAPEPSFVHGAVAKDGFLYLYACTPNALCRVARAPEGQATERAAYEFFAGADWSPDLETAVATVPGSTAGFSVAWSESLGRFLAASTPGFASFVEFRTAPAPEGPWSLPSVAFGTASPIYAVYLHPELSSDSTVVVSYSRQTGNWSGEIRLVEVEVR